MRARKLWATRSLSVGLLMSGIVHASEQFYNVTDFIQVEKIDAHVHLNSTNATFLKVATKNNFQLVSINVDYPDFPSIDEQQRISKAFSIDYPDTVAFASTFSMEHWHHENWSESVIQRIKQSLSDGAIAVKVWKNIGMDFRDANDQLVMLDNARFTPVFDFLVDEAIPLIGHQGEPRNCWLPVSEMTVENDKQYFTTHPQYHMFLHPELPSYEDQMNIRDKVLNKNPKLSFIGAHLASIEWSVDELSLFLDRYPQAVVDTAARMGQIKVQSKKDYKKVRDFFIKYQDRLLYATDLTHQPDKEYSQVIDEYFELEVETRWRSDWEYLSSDHLIEDEEVAGSLQGLHLPKIIINKLYKENALNVFNRAFKQ